MVMRAIRMGLVAAMLACAGTAMSAPPTDAEIDGLIQKVNQAGGEEKNPQAKAKLKQDAMKEALAGLSLGEASLKQIEKLVDGRLTAMYPALREAIAPRLVDLSKGSGVDGARAAELATTTFTPAFAPQSRNLTPESAQALADLLLAAFNHPGYPELVKAGKGEAALRPIASLPVSLIVSKHVLEAVEPHITGSMSTTGVFALRGLLTTIIGGREPVTEIPTELRERIRARIAAAASAAVEKNKDAQGPAAQQLKGLQDVKALAEGPWAKGTLVGNPAPDIEFTWVSEGGKAKSFADFKGKVVMIDFWATWCGPCRAAFPKLHQLADRYKGHDVVILGLTSPQGFHIDGKNARIDCKDDLAKEMGLMPELMKEMDVNWTIAFGSKNCFNPDFGVQGIPHVAIIDAKGVVRFNGLYPNPVEESEKIDALLKEAGLKAPEKLFEVAPPAPKPAPAAETKK